MISGVVLPGCYSDSHPQPDDDQDVSCIEFKDGVRVEYNRAQHVLTVSSPMLVELRASKLHVDGDVHIAKRAFARQGVWPPRPGIVPPLGRATGGGK